MQLEIHKLELQQRVRQQIESGQFHDVDELLTKALDALDEQASAALATLATGAVVRAALQASPYSEIDLTPPRVRLTSGRDDVL
jgi:Arc/MetJ-type ribon-helix-helix transcriptional regulator